MDIKAKIEEIIEKIKNDDSFAEAFKENPAKALEDVLDMNLPDDKVNEIVDGVKAKVSFDKASDLFNNVKKLF
jgi:hypothetical protein